MSLRVDLRPLLGSARDQGQRPTCLSFAASDAHRGARRHVTFFSPECLHARAASFLGQASDFAITPWAAGQALERYGQVEEKAWPYGYDGPIHAEASSYRAEQALQGFDGGKIETALLAGKPVVATLGIGDEFYDGASLSAPFRSVRPPVEAYHAVVIVGFAAAPDGSVYLLRNSWGSAWGEDGHAWAHAEYLVAASMACITYEGVN